MKNNLLIREGTFADLEAIVAVHHQSVLETYQDQLSSRSLEFFTHEKLMSQWEAILKNKHPQSVCFVAEIGGEIVGFVSGGPQRNATSALQGECYALYVLARVQKLGIGRALFEQATTFLQQHFTSQLLWVLKSNKPAIAFYEKNKGIAVQASLFQLGEESVEKICYLFHNRGQASNIKSPQRNLIFEA